MSEAHVNWAEPRRLNMLEGGVSRIFFSPVMPQRPPLDVGERPQRSLRALCTAMSRCAKPHVLAAALPAPSRH
jgi:hypothetical protein